MRLLRTPEDRFEDLPDFDYEPHYVDIPDPDGGLLRVGYVEAGPADGRAVLLLHGEPSWSFLYRKLLPVLADAGLRAVAPDLVGFGRSDKPAEMADHTYAKHVEWMRRLAFEALDLREVTLVGQDWGGLIGLRLVAEHPGRFAGVVAANTGLPTGDHDMPEAWWAFRAMVESTQVFEVGRAVQSGCRTELTEEVRTAYDAPFPNEMYKAGPRAMPTLVPTRPDDPATPANRAAWAKLSTMDIPFLCAFSDGDPITGPVGPMLQRAMKGATGREHPTITGAGHFLQEDAGEELGEVVARFARSY
ncbi:haloalkane dehalogenase [Amycolatopsis arida]|uniref:Haloalkane dehalogenase n=1 Tax=Amycolatopsis arida TaxID=587909 RepID=A0A1I5YMB4_9PSEU|nr:haloalkane dehalogenase [Amycolatopsis arida]TDX90602.1 haloalkane dehalogenase [Amycolatopsis arida]SFQ45037.1 haloalkane dehalogenase [Amycolatopsis arida]